MMCGDSTNIDDIKKLVGSNQIDMIFTSPPYDNNRVYRLTKKIDFDSLMRKSFSNVKEIIKDDCQIIIKRWENLTGKKGVRI